MQLVSSLILEIEEVPPIHSALPAAGWIVKTRTGTKRWCPVMLRPHADALALVKELEILTIREQYNRAPDKQAWINSLEVLVTPNQVEQLKREVELDLVRDQRQQDDYYYALKKNTARAVIDLLGANPYITSQSHPFRKMCLSDEHFRTVNPNWDVMAAHRTGRKLRSAWKNGCPWQGEPKQSPGWGIWRKFRTLISSTNLHEGPRHDAILVTQYGRSRMKSELPFSTSQALKEYPHQIEQEMRVIRQTEFNTITTKRLKGSYEVDQTLKLIAACGVQGMAFYLDQDILVDGEPVDLIITPEAIQAKSAWSILLNNNIPLDQEEVMNRLVEYELEKRTPPPGWRVADHLLTAKGVGLVVEEWWTSTTHNEVYFSRTDQSLVIRPEQHFCASLPFHPTSRYDRRDLYDYWQLARALEPYYINT